MVTRRSVFPAIRQHTDGFTLVEMMVCIGILGIMVLCTLSLMFRAVSYADKLFPDTYWYIQSVSMVSGERQTIENEGDYDSYTDIIFNLKGHVTQAQTLIFENGRKLVIEVGGGRLVAK